MKKFLFKAMAVYMAFFVFSTQLFAGTNITVHQSEANIIDFDENEIYSSFDDISELESFIHDRDISYNEVLTTNGKLVENVSSIATIALNQDEKSYPLVVGSFIWGCFFSIFGVMLVAYVTDKNPGEMKMAILGCFTSFVAVSLISLVILAYYGYFAI